MQTWFDPDLRANAQFDPDIYPELWFDREMYAFVASTPFFPQVVMFIGVIAALVVVLF